MTECEHPTRGHEILAELTTGEITRLGSSLVRYGVDLLGQTDWAKEHPEAVVHGEAKVLIGPVNDAGKHLVTWQIPTLHDPGLDELR